MATQLEIIANQQRIIHLAINDYKYTNEYSSTNKDAISDGDENGKGLNPSNGNVGSITDINNRTQSIARNNYNQNKSYPDF